MPHDLQKPESYFLQRSVEAKIFPPGLTNNIFITPGMAEMISKMFAVFCFFKVLFVDISIVSY
jgi:hypothetical protein